MPNRIIKDTICGSEKLNSLTDFQFRLWVGLITYVDDYGRGDARPAMIKGSVFPLRDRVSAQAIQEALLALARTGCVRLYEVDGKPYLYFPNWERHQRIQTKKAKYPDPPQVYVSHGELRWVTVDDGESPPESNPIQSNKNPNTNPNTNTNAEDAPAAPRTRFQKPTIEEVRAYCFERGNNVDAQHWFDYYEANGWRVGKNPMKDWKATVRTWERNGYDSKPGKQRKYITADDYAASPRPEIDMDELRRVIDKI